MTDSSKIVDLLVIGGGINGAGIAADAAGRNLSTMLVEKGDLASGTSSWSTKLIHGGLRYLEFFEFGLVRKALLERDVLTKAAPHIIKPIAFNIPQLPNSRSNLVLRIGLFLYDSLARSSIFQRSRAINFSNKHCSPLVPSIKKGFEYWDAQVDDSRLVVLNAQQAAQKGAVIKTYTECVGLQESPDGWLVSLRDSSGGKTEVRARVVVNAAGPWVARLLEKLFSVKPPVGARLVKGSHIVVPKLYKGSQAFMLQHKDGRVIFVIPYLDNYSLIGTTESEFDGELEKATISDEEIKYLISLSNEYFSLQLTPKDIVSTYSGVRPLIDEDGKDMSKVSRDYHLELRKGACPLLSVYGGKVTTYRTLAEDALKAIEHYLPTIGKSWTRDAVLPGGRYTDDTALDNEVAQLAPWLDSKIRNRWLRTYGADTKKLLEGISTSDELGKTFGHGLYEREIKYLVSNEWARSAEDILWRRTKLGYDFSQDEALLLDEYVARHISA